jgi:oxygen-independent coproporphyrinogen-3 oxidase
LALYIHWPFCVSKCPYCDFNSHVRASVDQDRWREALLQDLAYEAEQAPRGPLTSIFFGGGTPSLMPPETVAALISAADRHWGFARDIEITLEANPSSVEAARFADLASAGVNRVSLGLQSLDDESLRFLGRAHGVARGCRARHRAGRLRSRQPRLHLRTAGQSEAAWDAELSRRARLRHRPSVALRTHHRAWHALRRPRRQGRADRGRCDHMAMLYELTQARTQAAGLPAYEVSNHARAGEESRHNLTYWRYQPYLGVGPGAHGRRGGTPRSGTGSRKTGSPRSPATAMGLSRKRRSRRRIKRPKPC